MSVPRFCAGLLLILFSYESADARPRRARSFRSSASGFRNRLHVNPIITQEGTFEAEWAAVLTPGGTYSGPTTLKYTPEGDDFYFGSTEFSAAFDSFASVVDDGNRVTQWSDHLTFTALTQLSDKITGPHLSIAVGPQVTTILRGESGARIGAAAIARYTRGLSSGGVTCSWNGATASSDANPAGILDLGVGFGRQLAKSGFLNNLTLHANGLMEKSTGVQRTMSVFEGMEYQITNRLSVDVSGQHIHVSGGVRETQIQVGLTMNFGRPF